MSGAGAFFQRLLRRLAPPQAPLPAPEPQSEALPAMSDAQRYFYLGPDLALAKMHDGFCLYVDPMDEAVAAHLIVDGYWESWIHAVVCRLIRPGDHIAEVGANFGYYTMAMAMRVGPEGSITSLEANPRLAHLVDRSAYYNGWLDRVTVLNQAATDHAGPISFAVSRTNAGGGAISSSQGALGPGSSLITAAGVRLDDVAHPETRFIRIDAEGSEPLILRGAEQLLSRPDVVVCTEWDVVQMRDRGDVGELVDWLTGQGFRFWLIQYDATLAELDPEAAKTHPRCDVVIARQPPEEGL